MSDAYVADTAPPPAPADTGGVPIDTNPVSIPAPLGVQTPDKTPERLEAERAANEKPAKPPSIAESVRKANDHVRAKAAAEADAKAKAEAKEAQPKPPVEAKRPETQRAPDGKFARRDVDAEQQQLLNFAKDQQGRPIPQQGQQQGHDAPPARFAQDVKEIWPTLPERARAEIARMDRETTEGIQKHKAAAESYKAAYDGYAQLDNVARQHGKRGADVFNEYYQMEQLLTRDPVQGIETILNRLGSTSRQFAEHILGQTPDEQAGRQDQTISELRNEIHALKQHMGGVQNTLHQQHAAAVTNHVGDFAAAHPRFEELADVIARELQTSCPNDLPEAYRRACLLNPEQSQPQHQNGAAQTREEPAVNPAGLKSIHGAPSSGGSSPSAPRTPSKSIREALEKASRRARASL